MNLSLHPESILFLTLDSCRFDSFREATLPNLKSISPLHKAQSLVTSLMVVTLPFGWDLLLGYPPATKYLGLTQN